MYGSLTMAAADARGLPPDALVDLRKRVIAAVQSGASQAEVARLFGVSRQTVGSWVRAYRNRGEGSLRPGRRGRRPGEQLALTTEQQLWVARTVIRRTPDEIGLLYQVWTRQAVAELINREFRVVLGVTTIGSYLSRWGFPNPQDLLRDLRSRNALAVTGASAGRPAWIPGAEAMWIGYDTPQWTLGREPGWPDASVLVGVSNRGATYFLPCADPFDGRELRGFLERLTGQVRRRLNLIVCWQPVRNRPELDAWAAANATTATLRCLTPN
jgi:transposase